MGIWPNHGTFSGTITNVNCVRNDIRFWTSFRGADNCTF